MKVSRGKSLRIGSVIEVMVLTGGLCILQSVAWAETSHTQSTESSSQQAAASAPETSTASSRTVSKATQPGDVVRGKASWYGPGFHGKKTATGERFNSKAMTAASGHLPLGSEVVVTNMKNGKSVKVRINDCGPSHRGRKIDLSKSAARKLGITHDGTAPVKAEVVKTAPDAESCADLKDASR